MGLPGIQGSGAWFFGAGTVHGCVGLTLKLNSFRQSKPALSCNRCTHYGCMDGGYGTLEGREPG